MLEESDNTARILIVDDTLGLYHEIDTDFLFVNTGVDIETVVVRNFFDAFEQIEKWAGQGHKANIIDLDHMLPFPHKHTLSTRENDLIERFEALDLDIDFFDGIDIACLVFDWSKDKPEHLRPEKVFLHSRSIGSLQQLLNDAAELFDEELLNTVTVHKSEELDDIARICEGEAPLSLISDFGLRKYLNKHHGTKFPTSVLLNNMHLKPNKDVYPHQAFSDVIAGELTPKEAMKIISPNAVKKYFKDRVDTNESRDVPFVNFAKGVGGACAGRAAFNAEDIETIREKHPNDPVVLVVNNYHTRDNALFKHIDGFVLIGKGIEHLDELVSNHGISGIYGNTDDRLISGDKSLEFTPGYRDGFNVRSGDWITIDYDANDYDDDDHAQGRLYPGKLPITSFNIGYLDWFKSFKKWTNIARENDGMAVMANADTPEQIERAIDLGAEGIGLLRTEFTFQDEDSLPILQKVLLCEGNKEQQTQALEELKQTQKQHFTGVYEAAKSAEDYFPVRIRLLDPPPEEFIPSEKMDSYIEKIGRDNTRGAQLNSKVPGLYAAQAEAIFEAAIESGYEDQPEIMIPHVNSAAELAEIKIEIDEIATKNGFAGNYRFGAMIETIGAVKDAYGIAKMCDFISFGTNDLTSNVMDGIKRNDFNAIENWMDTNKQSGQSPFINLSSLVIDIMRNVKERAISANPDIEISVCGNQVAKSPESIQACHKLGIHSISVPANIDCIMMAMFAEAQAVVKDGYEFNDMNNTNYSQFEM